MMDMDMDVLLNPLENMNALIENFGSVHVYYPGDECPNFNYQLLNYIPFLISPLIRTIYPGSGIVDIAKMKDSINPYLIGKHYPPTYKTLEDIENFLFNRFKGDYVIYPSKTAIANVIEEKYINELKKHTNSRLDTSPKDLIGITDNILTSLKSSPILNITQDYLCNNIPPGIYYNFVCRLSDITLTNLYTPNYTKINILSALKSNPKDVGPIIRQRISNTLPRKQHLHNYYRSNRYKQKRLSPYNRKINSYQRTEKKIQNLEQNQIELNARINNTENAYFAALNGDEHLFALKDAQLKKKPSYNKALKERESVVRNLSRAYKSPSSTRKKRRASIY
jgi:exonuclease VII small subunit